MEVHDWSNTNRGELVDGQLVEYSELEFNFQHIGKGQFWRLITPAFVHGASTNEPGGLLMAGIHIFFNMYWLYWLGTLIEVRFGLKTYLTLFFVSAIASVLIPLVVPRAGLFGIQGLNGGAVVGMSGVVYAVIGFGWCKMRMQPSVGLLIPPFILIISMIWLFYGVFVASGDDGISHLAHLVGLITGSGIAYIHTLLGK